MPRKLKIVQVRTDLESAVTDAVSTLREELGEEMRSWHDNMSENLQNGDKGSAVEEAASALEDINDPSVPDCIKQLQLPVVYNTSTKNSKKGDPRWLRRDNATAALSGAIDAVNDWVSDMQQLIENLPEDAEDDTEISLSDDVAISKSELEGQISEAEQFVQELEEIKDSADGVEFPGMYG